ncbi:hypothetical protein JW826_02505, partial [Candidatus Woesearchaeota archaeon]|nr:hypothetical protein [Candidatus Woesearchaeota archaeon]
MNEGECHPGDTDSRGCGWCGTQDEVCSSSCTWTDTGSCHDQGVCASGSKRCVGNIAQTCTGSCQWNAGIDCTTQASTDTDGSPTAYTTGGRVTDYTICNGGACLTNVYTDTCSGMVLTEYGASSSTYIVNTYDCQNLESDSNNYCSDSRYYRQEWGCSGSPGHCSDAAVPDTPIGTNADGDDWDYECGDSMCDNVAGWNDAMVQIE